MDKLDDVIENMTFLYIMSKDIDYSKHPIKRVDMLKRDGITLTGEYFRKYLIIIKKCFLL